MGVAFFDLDKTILSKNSAAMWVRSEMKLGYLSKRHALKAWLWMTWYHMGFGRIEKGLYEAIAGLTGMAEADMQKRSLDFYETQVRNLIRPGARTALSDHRKAGDSLLLLTSSSNYVSEPIASQLDLDGFLCNRFETDANGRYTGRPLGTLCFGQGKLEVAKQYIEERKIEFAECTFYSDSSSDLPVFEAVGRPVAVNPDPRLKRIAAKRGWEIADWGEP